MSDETPTQEALPETTPEATAEKARRERESWPIRLLVRQGDAYTVHPTAGPFQRREEALRWVQAQGADGATYLPARLAPAATTVQPRTLVEVGL